MSVSAEIKLELLRKRVRDRFIMVAALSGVLAAVAVALFAAVEKNPTGLLNNTALVSINDLRDRLDRSSQEIARLKVDIALLKHTPSNGEQISEGEIRTRMTAYEERLDRLEESSKTLTAAVVDNPEKAMSLPLLRRDIEALKVAIQSSSVALNQQIDRVYDMIKWILGVIGASAASVLLFSLNIILRNKAPEATV